MKSRVYKTLGDFGQASCDSACSGFLQQHQDPRNKDLQTQIWNSYVDCCRAQETSKKQTSVSSPSSMSSAGRDTSAGEIMQGIGAILKPLADVGVGIFAAQQQAKLAKMQLKYQQQQTMLPPMPAYFPPPQQSSSMLLIVLLILVGLAMVGGMFYVMSDGGNSNSVVTSAVSAPRITKVRRIRKRPKK